MATSWEASLALQWIAPNEDSVVGPNVSPRRRGRGGGLGKLSAWERLAVPPQAKKNESAATSKRIEEVNEEEQTRRYYRPKLTKTGKLRRAAAASNTSTFVAQAQRRAALRAAAKIHEQKNKEKKVNITQPRKAWDVSPLQKLCDNDARRMANMEKRRRDLEQKNNQRFPHRESVFQEDNNEENDQPALTAARALIKARKEEQRRFEDTHTVPQVFSAPQDHDYEPHPITTPPDVNRGRSIHKKVYREYSLNEKDCDCVGEPRPHNVLQTQKYRRTRATSPFETRAMATALRAYEQKKHHVQEEMLHFSSRQKHQHQQQQQQQQSSLWVHAPSERQQYSAIEDMGQLARAVAGLVGSAAKTVELHEDAQRRAQQREHTLAAFHFWQERAQRQLDASLRMQQQQFATSMAELQARAASLQHPPPSASVPIYSKNSTSPSFPQHHPEEPSYLPFGGATPGLPSDERSLVERLWEKLTEIEEDEHAAIAALNYKKKEVTTTKKSEISTSSIFSSAPAAADHHHQEGAVSLPLGIVGSLIMNNDNPDQKWVAATAAGASSGSTDLGHPEEKEEPLPPIDPFATDADVPADAAIRIFNYRDKYIRFRKLLETDLLDTGLSQTTIVDVLADDILHDLLQDSSSQVDDAINECSETIFARA